MSLRTKDNIKIGGLLLLFIIVAIYSLTGCSTSKASRAQTAEAVSAAHSATINKSVEGTQIPNVTVSGSSNTVTIAPTPLHATTDISDTANTKGDASGDYRSTFHASFSTWLAIGFAAAMIGALLLAWVIWSKGSAAGAAADQGFAGAINTVATLATHSTEPAVMAALNTVRADLEKARGKIKR